MPIHLSLLTGLNHAIINNADSGCSSVVEHTSHHSKAEGSDPATTVGNGLEKMMKKFTKMHKLNSLSKQV
jgi:hypothetical protein